MALEPTDGLEISLDGEDKASLTTRNCLYRTRTTEAGITSSTESSAEQASGTS